MDHVLYIVVDIVSIYNDGNVYIDSNTYMYDGMIYYDYLEIIYIYQYMSFVLAKIVSALWVSSGSILPNEFATEVMPRKSLLGPTTAGCTEN